MSTEKKEIRIKIKAEDFTTYTSIIDSVISFNQKSNCLMQSLVDSVLKSGTLNMLSAVEQFKKDILILNEIRHPLFEIGRSMDSPIIESLRKVNLSVLNMIENSEKFKDSILNISQVEPEWLLASKEIAKLNIFKGTPRWMSAIEEFAELSERSRLLQISIASQFSEISQYTITTQAILSRISFDRMGVFIDMPNNVASSLQNCFLDMSYTYSELFRSFEELDEKILHRPPIIYELPSIEYFNVADLVDLISNEEEDIELDEKRQLCRDKIIKETDESLPKLLSSLNKDYVSIFYGYRDALDSNNPDSVRHFCTSFRELLTHVIHALAPDEKVRSWSKNPKHFVDKKPTREARIQFICRHIDIGPFCDLTQNILSTTKIIFEIFQTGTHSPRAKFTSKQLIALKNMAEGLLRLLVEVYK